MNSSPDEEDTLSHDKNKPAEASMKKDTTADTK